MKEKGWDFLNASTNAARQRDPLDYLALVLPVAIYLAIGIPVCWRQMAGINPDGIIYIRKAQFLLKGHFWQSVSGYWPPAISWCVALILKLGGHKIAPLQLKLGHEIVPLHAIHGVLLFFGMTWVATAALLLRSLVPTRPGWRTVAGIVLAFTGVRQCVILITPDLLLGTMLMAYLLLVSRAGLLKTPGIAFLAGLCAGLGYLCKSYALPFFCLHFFMTVSYRWWQGWRGVNWSIGDLAEKVTIANAFKTLAAGGVGFALFALPWVAILSHKYGHFTISMVYHHNHMNVAPAQYQDSLPDFCVVPPDPYICIWEGLDPGPRSDWSATASWQDFKSQLAIAQDHIGLILSDTAKFDYLGLTLAAALAAIVPWKLATGRSIFSAVPGWIVLSCAVYCVGFLIVAFEVRYIVPILLPFGLALILREWEELTAAFPAIPRHPWLPFVPAVVLALFLVSAFFSMGQFAFDSPARPIDQKVALMLKRKHLDNLFTSSDNNKGVNVAYYLDRKMVLIPYGLNFERIERELAAAGVNEILVWHDIREDDSASYPQILMTMLRLSGHWQPALQARLDRARRLDVYVRSATGATTAPSTQQAPVDGDQQHD